MVNHYTLPFVKIARQLVFEFIESWYNRKRQHAHLGYLSPEEFYRKHCLSYAA